MTQQTYLKYFLIILCVYMTFSHVCHANSTTIDVVIPGPLDGKKVRNPFVEELLSLAFEKCQLNLNLIYYKHRYTQGRALKELSLGGDIDLNWSTTSFEREALLRPIKIPLYNGLIGWRVLLIRQVDAERFAEVKSLEDLKSFIAVQRFDWTDYDILKANGLPVEGNLGFVQHSRAVVSGLADYFPRSVLEVGNEINQERNQELIIEPTLLLKYPAAYYFFVNKDNEELAQLIEHGLNLAIQDGSYMELFNRHFGEHIKALNLPNRTIIRLKNPLFPH